MKNIDFNSNYKYIKNSVTGCRRERESSMRSLAPTQRIRNILFLYRTTMIYRSSIYNTLENRQTDETSTETTPPFELSRRGSGHLIGYVKLSVKRYN